MAKNKKDIIEIEAVTINIGDTTVKVTPQQCRELYNALRTLLGEPYYSYTRPYWYAANGTGSFIPCDTLTTTTDTALPANPIVTANSITIQ